MSRCVVVLSIGRSGSSALSGMLHKMGVNMGEEFIRASWKNPWGTYEDRELYDLNRAVFRGDAEPSDYATFVAHREEKVGPVWGVKDPALCNTFHFLRPYLGDDVRVITIYRGGIDTVESFNNVELMGINAARKWVSELLEKLDEQLNNFDGPVLGLTWEDLKADPSGVAKQVRDFCYEGLDDDLWPHPADFNKAIDHIRPQEKKDEGFGKIAIGIRINKVPEPDLFVSWTAMITGNVRNGDTVLAPQLFQAAHHASTRLARAFLKSGRDTLLMIDDDMMFPPDTLERMRSKEENWQYDIVSCFATHKVWPPKPIIMQLMDIEDVSVPDRLKGDHYKLVHEFDRGDVIPVDAVGLAFTLIRRKVLLAMLHPDYGVEYTWPFSYGPGWESDDIPFSRNCRELGFTMAVDTDTAIQHVGKRSLGLEQFLAWQESMQDVAPESVDFNADDLIPILLQVANSDNGYSEKAKVMLKAIRDAKDE